MVDPQRHWEAYYQSFVEWGRADEVQKALRAVDPDELLVLLRSARRLGLIGDPADVERRTERIIEMIEAFDRWEQRRKDASTVVRIFAAVGLTVGALWAYGREFLTWLLTK
jgi:hypothetical protein